MHFDYDTYNKLFPRTEVKPPVVETPVETFKPTPKAVEPIETKTEVVEVPTGEDEKKEDD